MVRFNFRMEISAVDAVMVLERELLNPAVRSDRRQVEQMLASDFTEIGRCGTLYTRAQIIDSIGGFESSWGPNAVSTQMEGRMLADDIVLLTYITESSSGISRRTSIWRNLRKDWQIIFHQGTALVAPHLDQHPAESSTIPVP